MRTSIRGLLGAVATAGAVGLGLLALNGTGELPVREQAGAPTPVWSARRLPGPLVDPITASRDRAAATDLHQRLDAELAPYGASCFVVRRNGSVLASRDVAAGLIPASTQKLLVGTAVLAEMGTDFRFSTRLSASGGGSSVDRLWVVGSGDPVIRTSQFVDEGISTPLSAFGDAIVARGVRRIGTLVVDDGRYDAQRFLPSWRPSYVENLDVGPLGALMVNQGVTFVSGRPTLVPDPALHLGSELAAWLRARGVTVGAVDRGVAPPDATPIGTVSSRTLRAIVGYMLGVSDNVTAELLTKELGARLHGAGTTSAGVASIREVLGRLGVTIAAAPTVDGSGLDRGNRLTCNDLVAVLEAARRPELRAIHELLPGDPRVGGDGSVRGKSGYLEGVTGLAGTVERSALTFAFLLNDEVPRPPQSIVAVMRRVADAVASYSAPPRVEDSVVPMPRAVS
jgi:D-alanyl-D-alanine carboxypeptidase/D-alanyl-D-alanine-endopeptidase (penicillin-binding protein 4)